MTRTRGRRPEARVRAGRVAAVVGALAVPQMAAGQTSLTIYNDGRVLVRRELPAKLPKGAFTQRLGLGALDPASVFSLDPDVTITRLSYDGATDEASVLRRSVGKRVVFRIPESTDTVSALVLGVDPLRLRMPDGRVTFTPPGAALYPAEVAVADPTVTLDLATAQPQNRLRLGYFTGGATWQASYQAVLGPKEARVTGMAVLESQALRSDSAQVQLLAGSVGRAQPAVPPPMPVDKQARMAAFAEAMPAEQRVGEYHLYTLPGRHNLLPGQTTSIALFAPVQVPCERTYEVRGQIPFWGILPPQGEEENAPVEVSYTLKRPRDGEFGRRPLPEGVARLYQADSSGQQQLVGEAAVRHTAAGEDVRLSAGTAFDFTAKRVQTGYVTRHDSTKAGGVRTIATADYRVTVANATDSAATVDVLEERGGEWAVLSSSVQAEKLSSTRTRFRVKVPARGEAVVTYRVRIVW
jgi:hypothetical protein